MIDLISERVGGRVVECNDEFFAPAANLIAAGSPVANEEYTDRGKWMDGWETRRRREAGHDWCVIALGIPGRLTRVTVDTSHFTGNYPERFSLEATGTAGTAGARWVEVVGPTGLEGDSVAVCDVDDPHRVEAVRLNIFPDGGVARLRVEGHPIPAKHLVCPGGSVDLAAAAVGGEVVDASDLHYSHPSNLLRPLPSAGMWDGWETRRRRDAGHDWVTVRLGLPGAISSVTVDTTNFKGNAPGWVSVAVSDDGDRWLDVAERVPVGADRENVVELGSAPHAAFLRLSIHPDGGVARLRAHGVPDSAAAGESRVEYVDSLFDPEAERLISSACAAPRWVSEMRRGRPYGSVDAVFAASRAAFDQCDEGDWLAAFAGHPRIGDRGDDAAANAEQSGTASASRGTIAGLAEVNRDYEARFGFTYIVYASGKSADEMLAIARQRLGNTRQEEIANAAGEQRRITETRLRRMLCQEGR